MYRFDVAVRIGRLVGQAGDLAHQRVRLEPCGSAKRGQNYDTKNRTAVVPVSVDCTMALPAFKSLSHCVCMFSSNQAILATQVGVSAFVLHVPHTMAFSAVKLFCACL